MPFTYPTIFKITDCMFQYSSLKISNNIDSVKREIIENGKYIFSHRNKKRNALYYKISAFFFSARFWHSNL